VRNDVIEQAEGVARFRCII